MHKNFSFWDYDLWAVSTLSGRLFYAADSNEPLPIDYNQQKGEL